MKLSDGALRVGFIDKPLPDMPRCKLRARRDAMLVTSGTTGSAQSSRQAASWKISSVGSSAACAGSLLEIRATGVDTTRNFGADMSRRSARDVAIVFFGDNVSSLLIG